MEVWVIKCSVPRFMVFGELLPRADSPISYISLDSFGFVCGYSWWEKITRHRLSVSYGRAKTIRILCVWTRIFFFGKQRKKILRFQKYLDACSCYVIISCGLMIDSVFTPGCPVVPTVLFTWVTSTVAHYHRNIHSIFGTWVKSNKLGPWNFKMWSLKILETPWIMYR